MCLFFRIGVFHFVYDRYNGKCCNDNTWIDGDGDECKSSEYNIFAAVKQVDSNSRKFQHWYKIDFIEYL